MNANETRDVDCICTSPTIECLTGYALKPTFNYPTYSIAIAIAYHEIKRLQKILSVNYDIALQHDVRYSICRTPEQARIEQLKDHIQKLEHSA